jgi:hypothetical protein
MMMMMMMMMMISKKDKMYFLVNVAVPTAREESNRGDRKKLKYKNLNIKIEQL